LNKRIRDKKVKEYVEKFRLYKKSGEELRAINVYSFDKELHLGAYDLRWLHKLSGITPKCDGSYYANIVIDGIKIFSVFENHREFYEVFPELKPKFDKDKDYIEIDGVKFIKS
jgi:hypothetical protein